MNQLYPIFLKTDRVQIVLIGGGHVALEKLTFLLKSSPHSRVHIVALYFIDEVKALIKKHAFTYCKKAYEKSDLAGSTIAIGATDDPAVNRQIFCDARSCHILVNIADVPDLCDFYMGGIVTKGNLKIGISTNGQSPTMAKRLRQFFESVIPDNIDDLLLNLNTYRKTLTGDFRYKVENLNRLTESFVSQKQDTL